jgi:hypothetical protein
MPKAEYHRRRAEDCRLLARSCDDRQMAAALSELAEHYDSCANHFTDADQGQDGQMSAIA